jgi:hypothetical protein
MTHYFIDDQWNLIKGPMSVDEISKLANEYQHQYFPAKSAKSLTVLQEQVSPRSPSID